MGLKNAIIDMAFSSDGKKLAVGLKNNGIRIFDAKTGAVVDMDANYQGSCQYVEFSSSNNQHQLMTVSKDGYLRLYDMDSKGNLSNLRRSVSLLGRQPFTAHFSPDGQMIAVGFSDVAVIQVLEAKNWQTVWKPITAGINGSSIRNVVWSANGDGLVAIGKSLTTGKAVMRSWSVKNKQKEMDIDLPTEENVNSLKALPNNRFLYVTDDPIWQEVTIERNSGKVTHQGRLSPKINFHDQYKKISLSVDGQYFSIGNSTKENKSIYFDLSGLRMWSGKNSNQFLAYNTEGGKIKLEGWKNTTRPALNGIPLKLDREETSRSLAIDSSQNGFVLGAEWSLRAFHSNGTQQWRHSAPSTVWSVNQSRDGRWVVAAYGDGTIRWHRRENGHEVLALFIHADRKRWVLWTPEGFYAASEGGESLFGYHLNRGKDQNGEFVSARQLSELFNRPALVSQRLGIR